MKALVQIDEKYKNFWLVILVSIVFCFFVMWVSAAVFNYGILAGGALEFVLVIFGAVGVLASVVLPICFCVWYFIKYVDIIG